MLSASAISIAIMVVVFVQGYIGGITDSMFDSLVKTQTGHIKIMHSEYHEREDMMPLEYMVDGVDGGGYEQLVPILESVGDVKTIAPRIKFGVLLSYNGRSRSALGIGVDPEQEDKIAALSRNVIEGQYFANSENARTMLIGGGLADKLGIKTGDKLTILARTAYDSLRGMTFTVSGVFRYGITAMDDKLFYIPIAAASRRGACFLRVVGDGERDAASGPSGNGRRVSQGTRAVARAVTNSKRPAAGQPF